MWSNPNLPSMKINTIFPAKMNRKTLQDGLHQSGRMPFCRVHDRICWNSYFQLTDLVQILHLTQLARKIIHGCHPTSCVELRSPQRPTLHRSIQALITSCHNHTWQFSHCFQAIQVPRGSSPWMFMEKVYSTLSLPSIEGTAKIQMFDPLDLRFSFVSDPGEYPRLGSDPITNSGLSACNVFQHSCRPAAEARSHPNRRSTTAPGSSLHAL